MFSSDSGKASTSGFKVARTAVTSAPLFRGSNNLQGRLAVAAQCEGVVHASYGFARCFYLVAMQQIDWHQNVFNGAQRRAGEYCFRRIGAARRREPA